MRASILAAGAVLAISACGSDQASQNTANVDDDLAAQNISANDTTSIDAATSEDANMAEDVDFTLNDVDNLADGDNAADNSADGNDD